MRRVPDGRIVTAARARGMRCALAALLATFGLATPRDAPAAASGPAAAARVDAPPAFDLGGVSGGVRDGRLEIWTHARPGEGWLAIARRATSSPARWKDLCGGRENAPLRAGQEVVIPRDLWRAGDGHALLARLFPRDTETPAGRRHVVTDGARLGFAESPWSLATLFTGSGKLHEKLGMDEAVRTRGLRPGDAVLIPADLLLPVWRAPGDVALRVAVGGRPARTASAGGKAPAGTNKKPAASADAAPSPPPPPADAPTAAAVPPADAPVSAFENSTAPAGRPVLAGSGGLASEGSGSLALVKPGDSSGGTAAAVPRDADPPAGADAAVATAANGGGDSAADGGDDSAVDGGDDSAVDGDGETTPPDGPSPPARDILGDFVPGDGARAPDDAFVITPGTRSADGELTFALDKEGAHAIYRLKKGETLYTHVVMRFTGLLSGKDVNDAALRLAARSRIDDVRQIPAGSAVRIPLADLLPEFLPIGHPRRVRWQQEQSESTRLARRERRKNLEGVHVVLDSGHGGGDPGAGTERVWEDDYAYDLLCRLKAVLEDRTRARVHPIIRDLSSGHAPLARIARDRDEVLLTTPAWPMKDWSARSAVNLRWILANDIRRRLEKEGVPDDRIVFLSIHADSLHESARGSMAYYASAQYRTSRSGVPSEPAYRGIQEVRPENGFEMSRREMLRSEGLSRDLGESLIAALREAGLPVHGFSPVRGSIVRAGAWVPAVLKYNRIQAGVLFEACNLNNPADQKNLRDPAFRQDMAEALVLGLESYFNGRQPATAARAAR